MAQRMARVPYDSMDEQRRKLYERLKEVLIFHPTNHFQLAKNIGISRPTLINFMNNSRPTSLVSMCKIERYIMELEKNL